MVERYGVRRATGKSALVLLPVVAQPSCLIAAPISFLYASAPSVVPARLLTYSDHHQSEHLRSCPSVEGMVCLNSLELPDIMNLEIHTIWVSFTESLCDPCVV